MLARQLKNTGLKPDSAPHLDGWKEFLNLVEQAYMSYDQDRYLLERSLSISSREMNERWNQIEAAKSRWKSLVENAPELIVTLDQSLVVQFSNQRVGNYSAEEVIGKNFVDLFPFDFREFIRSKFDEVLRTGENTEFTVSVTRATEPKSYLIRVGMASDAKEAAPLILISSDITEKLEKERLIQEQQAQMVESSRLSTLGEMAAGVAHEINNPLTILQCQVNDLIEGIESKEIQAAEELSTQLNKVHSTIDRISRIVKGLKSFARDSTHDPMEIRHMKDLIQDALELCAARFRYHSVDLKVLPVPEEAFVLCRPTQISQVILNLLNNAFDAVETLEEKWVRVEVEIQDQEILVSVTDSGRGISEDIVDKIVQPFFTTKEVGKGTGLGLSISKGIIESHNGKLNINRASKHTRFEVLIPRVDSDINYLQASQQ